MGTMVVTLKIMPSSPEINLDYLTERIKEKLKTFNITNLKKEIKPIAFGLNSIHLYFTVNEDFENLESIENKIKEIEGVSSAEIIGMSRALG